MMFRFFSMKATGSALSASTGRENLPCCGFLPVWKNRTAERLSAPKASGFLTYRQIPDFAEHGSILEQVMAHLPADLKSAKEFEAKSILQQLGISNVDSDISTLSGGERRRAGIAAAWIQPSDVLLLDEPTNHIDYETVQFLEDQLKKYRGAIVMVTHDRYFLNRITNQIVEVDRGNLFVSVEIIPNI